MSKTYTIDITKLQQGEIGYKRDLPIVAVVHRGDDFETRWVGQGHVQFPNPLLDEFKRYALVEGAVDSDKESLANSLCDLLDIAADRYDTDRFHVKLRVEPFAEHFVANGRRGVAYVTVMSLAALPKDAPHSSTRQAFIERGMTNAAFAAAVGEPFSEENIQELHEWIHPPAKTRGDIGTGPETAAKREEVHAAIRQVLAGLEVLDRHGVPVSHGPMYTFKRTAIRFSVMLDYQDLHAAGASRPDFDIDGPHTFPR